MTIRKFLILLISILLFLVFFLLYKHLEQKKYIERNKQVENYSIIKTSCSYSIRGSSSIYISYNGKEYKVLSTNNACKEISKGTYNLELYHDIDKDILFIGNLRFFFAYMVITFVFLIFSILGFFIYRNELDNSYRTM